MTTMRRTLSLLDAARRVLAAAVLVFPAGAAAAQGAAVPVDAERSTLSYTGHHPLHGWTGTSTAVRGELHVDPVQPARSRVTIVVPVESFDSGNGSRDSNMLDVVEADAYPDVRFVSEAVTVASWEQTGTGYRGRWRVRGPLTFHGETHTVEVPVDVTIDGAAFTARAAFQVSLDRFGVDRPKLLLMPVKDALDLEGAIHASLDPGA